VSFRQTVAEKKDRDAPCDRRRVAATHDCAPLTVLTPSGYLTLAANRFGRHGRAREAFLISLVGRRALLAITGNTLETKGLAADTLSAIPP
jgi:hypothetical protein